MKLLSTLLRVTAVAVIGLSFFSQDGFSQSRVIGAQSLLLDDGAGHTYLLQVPSGMTGNLTYFLPLSPSGNPPAGFVNVGTASGQTLYWNSVNNAWQASSIVTNNTNGNGTNVTITAPTIETSSGNRIGPAAAGTDGTYLTINGANGGATELQVNGDASITGSETAGSGAFNTLSVGGGKLNADVNGNLTKINNVTYGFPAAQAAAIGAVLTNDGAGDLTWKTAGSNSAQVIATNSTYTGGGSLGSNQNDLAINANSAYFKINTTANINITGINSTGSADGRLIYFSNVGVGAFTVTFNSQNASSATADRFILPGGFDITTAPGSSAIFIYDAAAQRWRLLANN